MQDILLVVYFAEKATKVIPYFQLLAPFSICLNHQLVFASPKQP
jgi:hypothetical protein